MKRNKYSGSRCGGKRTSLAEVYHGKSGQPIENSQLTHEPVAFKYIGKRSLKIKGPISRNQYFFNKPGSVIEIDSRDQTFFHGVPNLELYVTS